MNDKHLKGKISEITGKTKEDFGHAVGNDSLAGKGILQQVKGKVQQGLGDLKDVVKNGIDSVLNRKSA